MTFENLSEHISEEGCSMLELDTDLFLASNCINGKQCLIERLDYYGIVTLCHYILELNVDVPEEIEDIYQVYSNARNKDLN
jgi:hypothetical protein